MSEVVGRVRKLLESRLADLDGEAERLERAIVAIGDGRGDRESRVSGQAGTGLKTVAGAKPGGRRARRGQRRAELLAAIQSSPGSRPADLARAMGIQASQVHALIAKARAEKVIVRRDEGYAIKG